MSVDKRVRKISELFFTNKSDAFSFQEDYKKHGYIKSCFHAQIKEYHHSIPKFEPICKQSSYKYVGDENHFIGCPDSCVFYKPIIIGNCQKFIKLQRERCRKLLLSVRFSIKWFLDGYSRLTASVQLLFAICILIMVFGNSPVLSLIIRLFKAFNH